MHEKVHISVGKNLIEATAPVIISASRATDIPAFYLEQFIKDYERGYAEWINPFNNKSHIISFLNCRVVVFWTKDAKPVLEKMNTLKNIIPNFYFHYTINDYENENIEPNLLPLEDRMNTFIELSKSIGKEKVIWRFDPIVTSQHLAIDLLLKRVENIGNALKSYTNRLVVSFIDIEGYVKVKKKMRGYRELSKNEVIEFAAGLREINKKLNLEIVTCSENINLSDYGIINGKCVDDKLMLNIFNDDKILKDFLLKAKKDKGQRKHCNCILSKDIGKYNTCKHGCTYCYAS